MLERWRAPLAAAVLLAATVIGFVVERGRVSLVEREGGLLRTYEVDTGAAVEEARDRVYFGLRDLLALDRSNGIATPGPAELRRLRARVRLERSAERRDRFSLALLDPALTPERVLPACGGLDAETRADGRSLELRLPDSKVASIRAETPRLAAEVLRRRLHSLGVRGTVALRGDRVEVALPDLGATALREMREILGQTGRLEMKLLDDEADFISEATRKGDGLPRGLSFALENVPVGETAERDPRSRAVPYARMMRVDGEPLFEARRRLLRWAAQGAPVDGDHEVGTGQLLEYDEERDRAEVIGWRTYHLLGKPEITGDLVQSARAQHVDERDGWIVRMELTPSGAERFDDLTARNVRRRFAILLDGRVESAPVILSRIPGGVATITMGSGPPEQQRADAERLALVLLSGALPAPLVPLDERRIPPSPHALSLHRALMASVGVFALALLITGVRATRRRAAK
jgi:preprotein translocase subunit SecD